VQFLFGYYFKLSRLNMTSYTLYVYSLGSLFENKDGLVFMRLKWPMIVCFALLVGIGILVIKTRQKPAAGDIALNSDPSQTSSQNAMATIPNENALPNNVLPVPANGDASSPVTQNQAAQNFQEFKPKPGLDLGFGRVQPVNGNSSAQAASVLEALKTRSHPERLSLMHPPQKTFDKAAFDANPEAYLNVVEPGRVFQTEQPGKEVTALTVVGSAYKRVIQGDTVVLTVKGVPLAPVTFTSTDMGAFAENKLNSVSVRADDKGVAKVTFVAASGALNDVNIMAGSPLASGQALFKVDIERKR
jgi:hypothetical protein